MVNNQEACSSVGSGACGGTGDGGLVGAGDGDGCLELKIVHCSRCCSRRDEPQIKALQEPVQQRPHPSSCM